MSVSSKKIIFAALAGNASIAITKFIAAVLTGSSAMMSEGIHSLIDTGNQVLLLHGMKQASKPADKQFPFGHGKEIYFWSFIVAILIFAVGAGVSIYEGVIHIIDPQPISHPMINYVVLGLALLFEGAAWAFALSEFSRAKGKWGYLEAVHRGKDPTLFVVLFEDSAAMLGLLVAFLGVYLSETTGILMFDGIASVIIGMILGGTAIWLAYETKSLLIGESAETEVVNGIRAIVQNTPFVKQVNEILTMHMGPDFILVNLSIDFQNDLAVGELEKNIAKLDREVKQMFPAVKRVFIEAEASGRTDTQ
ncbi:MAG: cation diffusion facilitator family transporter [Gammaproteobacteria bacterium]|nr:cation diffusion facilitator family transporter [Gammaproteobacteria bacterium]